MVHAVHAVHAVHVYFLLMFMMDFENFPKLPHDAKLLQTLLQTPQTPQTGQAGQTSTQNTWPKPLEATGKRWVFFHGRQGGREGVGNPRFVKTETKPPSSGKTDEENENDNEKDENHDVFARLSVNGVRVRIKRTERVSG